MDLQTKFMDIINEMKANNVEFPPEFQIFYTITEYHDRRTRGITIRPFLREENAINEKQPDKPWNGKYSVKINSTVVSKETVLYTYDDYITVNAGGAIYDIEDDE